MPDAPDTMSEESTWIDGEEENYLKIFIGAAESRRLGYDAFTNVSVDDRIRVRRSTRVQARKLLNDGVAIHVENLPRNSIQAFIC